jgi:hypothetical protein
MIQNKISAEINDETISQVRTSIAAISSSLPFLIDLTQDEKKQLPKFGDKSVAFVNKTLENSKTYTDMLPRNLSVEEFAKDVRLYNQLFSVVQPMRVLMDKLEDTFAQAGAEAYSAALAVYSNLKVNKGMFDGSESVLDELSKRFVQKVSSEVPVQQVS